MRLGIFGGAFDPVHYGHLLLAEQCREQCGLDEVWFVPAGRPAHREGAALAAGEHRARMLELATASHPAFRVDRRELDAPGVSYTVDTLEAIRRERPGAALLLLITDDWLVALHTWKNPKRIGELATVVVVNRARPQDHLAHHADQSDGERAERAGTTRIPESVRERLLTVEMPGMGHAGTDLRRRIGAGRSVRYLTPQPVVRYLLAEGLYQARRSSS